MVIMVDVNVELDCKGMFCPMPIVHINKAAKNASSGEVIRLLATDPGSVRDVPAWAQKTGNELLDTCQDGEIYEFIIKVK